jgi:hypothetical protein
LVGKIKSATFAPALREKLSTKRNRQTPIQTECVQLLKKANKKEKLENKALFFLKSFVSLKI